MIMRIVDKQTNLFIRDGFTFDPLTEIGLEVEPAQGLYLPRWNGESWEEAGTPPEPTPPEPTLEERATNTESKVVSIEETIDVLFGGGE